jgi:hypothetical protein
MNCKKIVYLGNKAMEIRTKKIRLVVMTSFGPRIAFFGKVKGDNLLFWDNKNRHRAGWKLYGGHRVWPARVGADESEDAYRPDNCECEVISEKNSLVIVGQVDPVLKIQRGLWIEVHKENGLKINNFVKNCGDMLYSCSVWSLTCTNPGQGRRYGIPLGNNSEWDSFNLVMFRKWGGGHTSSFNDRQITFTEDMMIINPQGKETKRMLESHSGIMAMDVPDQDTTFVKKVNYVPDAKYPLGCNMAFYVGPDNFMVEMETMSPEVTLKPGEMYNSPEYWLLTDKSTGLDGKKLKNLTYFY